MSAGSGNERRHHARAEDAADRAARWARKLSNAAPGLPRLSVRFDNARLVLQGVGNRPGGAAAVALLIERADAVLVEVIADAERLLQKPAGRSPAAKEVR
jgi:ribosomal protein L18